MIDIQKIFEELNQGDSFKRIKADGSPINIYCGLREANLPSIAFMSQNPPLNIESTQYLKVSQWEEKERVYWSSFDLQSFNARTIFYALCLDLIQSTIGTRDDSAALIAVKNRYMVWRKMFRKASMPMSLEEYQGLYGELYFLYYKLWRKIGTDAIKAWSGASRTAKDFSYKDDWFEVKTISTNANEVKISSLTQLESETEGHLLVVRVEKMSDEYDDGHSTVDQLISTILNEVEDAELKDLFLSKVTAYGYQVGMEEQPFPRYKVHACSSYLVSDGFPRITNRDVKFDEITKVAYSIATSGIKKFLEDDTYADA